MSFKSKNDINQLILRYRWLIMMAISVLVIFVEYTEHADAGANIVVGGFLWETIVFGILMPITGGLVLSLISDRTKINSILERIDRQRTLKNALLSARDWDELVTIISQIPHTIFPTLFGDALYIQNTDIGRYSRASAWMPIQGQYAELNPPELVFEDDQSGDLSEELALNTQYKEQQTTKANQNIVVYSLPIIHLDAPIAVIRLLFLDEHRPSQESLTALAELAVDIALAIQNFQFQSDFTFQSAAAQAERQRIARQLHDTLAQDLAFLRIKLEQLLYDDRSRTGGDFGDELFRLYKTADHSYEQVRNSLRSMRGDTKMEFSTALYESANTIASNSDFKVEIVQEGSPIELTVEMQRKILYIMREVLRNIGKHAHANLTRINIHWEKSCIQIDTIDNGVGFDLTAALQGKKSCGLNIIEEVVAELDGRFDLESRVDNGTSIHLWFPILRDSPAAIGQ